MTTKRIVQPFNIEDAMNERKELLNSIIKFCKAEIKKCPQGNIYASRRDDGDSYKYYTLDDPDTERHSSYERRHYLDRSQDKLKRGLAQKKYYERLVREAGAELKAIESYLKLNRGDSLINVYGHLNQGLKNLIVPVISDDVVLCQDLAQIKMGDFSC